MNTMVNVEGEVRKEGSSNETGLELSKPGF